jgi:hypothetical protein
METYEIISLIMLIVASFFGVLWGKAKMFIAQLKVLITTVSDAILDNKVTREELEAIARELRALLDMFKVSQVKRVEMKIKNLKK